MEEVGLTTQYRFLISLGLLKEAQRFMGENQSCLERVKSRLAMKTLILPDGGMGDTLKVLIQHKGLDNPQLDGLRDMETL